MILEPALALLELASIAVGIRAGDAMAKRATLQSLRAGTVHPGRYLILAAGDVAEVEEALAAGLDQAGPHLVDRLLLPAIDPQVIAALLGSAGLRGRGGEALGVIETCTVAATIGAADAAVKAANVQLADLRLADGLGGKAYALFAGTVGDVEAAVAAGVARVAPELLVEQVVIAQLHGEMRDNLERGGELLAPLRAASAAHQRATAERVTPPRSTPPSRRRRRV